MKTLAELGQKAGAWRRRGFFNGLLGLGRGTEAVAEP